MKVSGEMDLSLGAQEYKPEDELNLRSKSQIKIYRPIV
jgi:hypothetical protein